MGGHGSGRKKDPVKQLMGGNTRTSKFGIGGYNSREEIILPDYSGVAAHSKTKESFDDRYIKTDGTSTTTADIPFAQGLTSNNITIGTGEAATDYTLTFDGETNDGVFTWMEDEDYLKVSDDILMEDAEKVYFRDVNTYIFSNKGSSIQIVANSLPFFEFDNSSFSPICTINPDDDSNFTTDIKRACNVHGAFSCDSITNDTGLAAGTWTPTITGVANVDSTTAYECQYMRVGNVVTCSGRVDVDATSASGTLTQVGISLPVASNFANARDCGGTAGNSNGQNRPIGIRADATNDRAEMRYQSTHTNDQPFFFTFTYRII